MSPRPPSAPVPLASRSTRLAWLFGGLALVLVIAAVGARLTEVARLGHWRAEGELVEVRARHAALRLDDGAVLVVGGVDTSTVRASIERWTPDERRFRIVGQLRTPRADLSAVALPGRRALFVGGRVPTPDGAASRASTATELWDGDAVVATGTPSRARSQELLVALPDGRALFVGGVDEQHQPILDTELWSPEDGRWRPGPRLPIPILRPQPVWTADGRLALASAVAREQVAVLVDVGTGTVSESPPLDPAWGWVRVNPAGRGRFLVVQRLAEMGCDQVVDSALWDPATGALTRLGPLPSATRARRTVVLPDQSILIPGGVCFVYDEPWLLDTLLGVPDTKVAVGRYGRGTWILRPDTDWRPAGELLANREGGQPIALDDGRVLLIGGVAGAEYRSIVELWTPRDP